VEGRAQAAVTDRVSGAGGVLSPVKYFFNGAIPELMNSSVGSCTGTTDAPSMRRWPWRSKKRRKVSRIVSPSMGTATASFR
jgi:hypothetical protein